MRLPASLLFAALIMSACSDGRSQGQGDTSLPNATLRTGSVSFQLALPPGIGAGTLSYTFAPASKTARDGTLPVTGGGATFGLMLDDLPAGKGYLTKFSGPETADGACTGSTMVEVRAGLETRAIVKLQCPGMRAAPDGSPQAGGKLNQCALIESLVALPLSAAVGESVSLTADASDADEGPSAPTFKWTSTGGELGSMTDSHAVLKCVRAGEFEVRLSVSDGDCGDSVVHTLRCGSDAEIAAAAPPAPDAGAGSCHDCQSVSHGSDRSCPDSVARCEQLPGKTSTKSPIRPGTSKAQLCQEILTCMQTSACAAERGTDCLCGKASDPNKCFEGALGAMDGPCKDLIIAGSESKKVSELALRFTDPLFAIGAAYAVVETCDQMYCSKQCL